MRLPGFADFLHTKNIRIIPGENDIQALRALCDGVFVRIIAVTKIEADDIKVQKSNSFAVDIFIIMTIKMICKRKVGAERNMKQSRRF